MPTNFLIRTINRDDLVKTKKTRLYKIAHPYDTTRKCVMCINHKPQWFVSEHFKIRMCQRKISFFDVFKTLRFGESLYGKTNYERRTSCVFFDRRSRIIVVTTGNTEVLITCFRSEDDLSFENKIKEYSANVLREEQREERKERKRKEKFKNRSVWKDKNNFGNFIQIA